MTDILMSTETRIRVIEHALKLLDAFNAEFRKSLSDGSLRMNAHIQTTARKNAEEEGRLRRRLAKLRKELNAEPEPERLDKGLAKVMGNALCDALPGFELIDAERDLSEGDRLRIKAVSADSYQADLVAHSAEDLEIASADLMSAVFSLEFPEPGKEDSEGLFFNITYAPNSTEAGALTHARTFEITRAS